MGRVKGKIVGHRRVELRKGAHVEGDLSTQALVIEEGVFFQGLCQMTAAGQTSITPSAAQTSVAPSSRESRAIPAGTEQPKPYAQDLYSGTTTKSSN